jgi:hypothetical protein
MFSNPCHSLIAALQAAPMVHGHYIFSQLIVNDKAVGSDFQYIRKNSNSYMPSFTSDVINSKDLICNKGGLDSKASTYAVKAGDIIGAKLWYNELIEHPGPGMVYMSKAPGDVSNYMGDGDWFKVWESGPTNGPANKDTSWGTWQKDRMTFTIPKDIPDGEYLVRFEHVAIHENHVGKSQFYMECAQLSVTGGGAGSPGPLVKIPGLYTAQDPAFTYSIWDGVDKGYKMPGPAVWSGGGSNGASSSPSVSTKAASDAGNATEPISSDTPSSADPEVPGSYGSSADPDTPVAGAPVSSGSDTPPATGAGQMPAWGANPSSSSGSGAPAPSASMPLVTGSAGTPPAWGVIGGWGTHGGWSGNNGGWGKWGSRKRVGGAVSHARRAVMAQTSHDDNN